MERCECLLLNSKFIFFSNCFKSISKFNRTVWLIYPRHGTPISIKIGQHLLKLCTKYFGFWYFYAPQCTWNTVIFQFPAIYIVNEFAVNVSTLGSVKVHFQLEFEISAVCE